MNHFTYFNAERIYLAGRSYLLRLLNSKIRSGAVGCMQLNIAAALHTYCDRNLVNQLALASDIVRHQKTDSFNFAFISGTGCLVASSEDKVFKVPLNKSAIENARLAFKVRQSIQQDGIPSLTSLIDYDEVLHDGQDEPTWIECERLTPVSASKQLDASTEAFSHLRLTATNGLTPEWLRLSWADCVMRLRGVTDTEQWALWVESASDLSWTVGPTHFDLTPGNILHGRNGVVLIDMSRFRMDGIQEFDAIHFEIERKAKASRRSWIDTIIADLDRSNSGDTASIYCSLAEGKWPPNLLRAYFLTRTWLDGHGEFWKVSWCRKVAPLAEKITLFASGHLRS